MKSCKICANEDCTWRGHTDHISVGCLGFDPQTNADRIRAMSDEEFAEWLDAVSKACYDEGYTKETDEPQMSPYPSTASTWATWLKQEATDEKG